MIFFFFWARPRWGCFLILPSPLFLLSTTTFLLSTRFSSVTPNGFSSDAATQRDVGRKKREGQGLDSSPKEQPSMAAGKRSSGRQRSGLYWRGEAAGNGAGSTDAELPPGAREIRMTAVERSCVGSKEWRWNKEGARGWVTETSQKLLGGPARLLFSSSLTIPSHPWCSLEPLLW